MSEDFLSQDEVDALLKGVNNDTDAASPETAQMSGPKAYDIGRQERIVRSRMPALELINERFARYLRIGMFNYTQRTVEVSTGPVKIQKYSEFIGNLVVPTNLNLIHVKPLRGTGLMVFDPNMVFLVIDNVFGGDGRFHTRVEGRDFTATEQRIINGLLNVVFREYEKAWKPVYPISFEYIRSEMNTQFANIATPSEIVITVTFTIELSNNSSEIHLCLPYSMIEPIRDILHSGMHSEQASSDKRWSQLLSRQLQTADVELRAPLGHATVTLGDIVKMKNGDIIPLNVDQLISASIDGVPVLKCRYGVQNGQYALKVDQFAASADDDANVSRNPSP